MRVCTIKIFCFALFTLVKFIQYFLLAVLPTFLHFKSQSLSKSLHRSLLLELSFHNSVIFIFCHFSRPIKILNNVLSIWFSSFLPFSLPSLLPFRSFHFPILFSSTSHQSLHLYSLIFPRCFLSFSSYLI